MWRAIADLLYPRGCPACGAPGAGDFCAPCDGRIRWIHAACPRCALPHVGLCTAGSRVFDKAASAALYDGPARDALLRFKIGGERRAARVFADAIEPLLDDLPLTYVPSTRRALAERGFNPAEAIARATGRATLALLRKTRETSDQSGLDRRARRANLSQAFEPAATPPERLILIDDILTTGATAEACADALKAGGAKVVSVVTFARTR